MKVNYEDVSVKKPRMQKEIGASETGTATGDGAFVKDENGSLPEVPVSFTPEQITKFMDEFIPRHDMKVQKVLHHLMYVFGKYGALKSEHAELMKKYEQVTVKEGVLEDEE